MKKQKNRNYYRGFALGSLGLVLFLGAGAVLLPELENTSSALTCADGLVTNTAGTSGVNVGDVCEQSNVGVNVSLGEVLNISVDSTTANFGNLTTGALSTKDITLTADTNVAKGYNVQLHGVKTVTAATSAAATDLIRSSSPYATISTFASDATDADRNPLTFKAGNWGYMVTSTGANASGSVAADTKYSAIPTSGSTAATVRNYAWYNGNLTKSTTFRFGVKPAANQAAGEYKGKVTITVTPNS